MVYGYMRVSSDKQTVENQRFEINKFCEKQNIVILIKELLKNGTSKRKIAKICRCDRNTLDRFIALKGLAVN